MPRESTWLDLIRERVGVLKAGRVVAFAVCWHYAEEKVGREPSIEEYSVHWNQSARTTYRELALWREALGEWYPTPSAFYADVGAVDFTVAVPPSIAGGLA